MKSSLKMSHLQKLGKMSLAASEKASEGAETAEEADTNLKNTMEKQCKSVAGFGQNTKQRSKAKEKRNRRRRV